MTNKVPLTLELFHETRDDLVDLAYMYNCTPSQLVTAFVTFRLDSWFRAMTDDEKKRFRKHKLKRAEAKAIGVRYSPTLLTHAPARSTAQATG